MSEIAGNGLEVVRRAECHVAFSDISHEDAEFITMMLENEDRYFEFVHTTYEQDDQTLDVCVVCSPNLREDPLRTITHLVNAVRSLGAEPSDGTGTDAA